MTNPLFDQIRTIRARDRALSQIEAFLNALYKEQKGSLKTMLSYSFSEELALILTEMLAKAGIDETYKMQIQTFFHDLTESLHTMPVLKLTLAFAPTEHLVEQMSMWVRKNIDPQALLSCSIDDAVIAGAVIEYQGVYKDLSLEEVVAASIQNKRTELLALLA